MQRVFIAKLLVICSLALSSALAFALPSPKDIDAAVSAGRLAQAESMLREVIKKSRKAPKRITNWVKCWRAKSTMLMRKLN